MAYSTLKGVNKNNEHSLNEHRSEFGKVLGKTIDIIAMQTALPAGLVNLGMDIFVRATGNSSNGLTYFDAASIGLLTIPVIKKAFDRSLSDFEESITTKNYTFYICYYILLFSLSLIALDVNIAPTPKHVAVTPAKNNVSHLIGMF